MNNDLEKVERLTYDYTRVFMWRVEDGGIMEALKWLRNEYLNEQDEASVAAMSNVINDLCARCPKVKLFLPGIRNIEKGPINY